MNRDSFYPAIACFPLLLMLAGCAPMHETRQALSQQTPAAQVDTALPTALKNGWPDSQWWLEYHDNQLTSLINNALQNAPDMQVADKQFSSTCLLLLFLIIQLRRPLVFLDGIAAVHHP